MHSRRRGARLSKYLVDFCVVTFTYDAAFRDVLDGINKHKPVCVLPPIHATFILLSLSKHFFTSINVSVVNSGPLNVN